MARFSGIFRKLKPEEYNKYPFILAVATKDTLCHPPIPGIGYLDRALITSAGGFSKIKIPETEDYQTIDCAPKHRYYYYSDRVLHPAKGEDLLEKYSFWIPKKDFLKNRDLGTHAVLTLICEFLNQATGNDISTIRDWEIPIDQQYDIYPEIESFIDKATEFIQLELTESTLIDAVREKVSALRKVADDLDKALDDEPSEWKSSDYATEYHDGGMTGDPHGEFWCPVFFGISKEYWKNTLGLLHAISKFDFSKKFAYCDIACRQQHIAAFADILSQQSLCLFYSKWKELFTWYSNRMQAASFNMTIRDIESQKQNCEFRAWNVFLELCAFDMSQTNDEYSFLIKNKFDANGNWIVNPTWEWKDITSSCKNTGCNRYSKCWLSFALANNGSKPHETHRWDADPLFSYDPQMITILTNLYYIYNCAQNEIKENQDQAENIRERVKYDLDFNFSIIARAIRVFCENVLLALYKIGRVPGFQSCCYEDRQGYNNTVYRWRPNPITEGVNFACYYSGSVVDQDRIKSDAIRTKDFNQNTIESIDDAYHPTKNPDHQLACRDDILNLLNIANPEMHATGESPEFDEYADILGRIEDISKEVLGLLRKNAGVS